MQMIGAERRRILEIRKSGTVASEVIADVLASLDVEESMLDSAEQERDEAASYASRRWTTGDVCDDLLAYPVADVPSGEFCQGCLDDGTHVGGPAALPGVRQRRVLRLLTPAARYGALPRHRARRSCSRSSPARTGAGATSTT